MRENALRFQRLEQHCGLLKIAAAQDAPVLEAVAAGKQREPNVGQRLLRVFAQMGREPARGRVERALAASGDANKLPFASRNGTHSRKRRFLQHNVRVGAADAQRRHACTPRSRSSRPRPQPIDHVERRVRERDRRIGGFEVRRGRNLTVRKRERRLDQTRDAGRRVQVTDIRLDRTKSAGGLAQCAVTTEGLHQRRNFDGFPQRCPAAVGLDVLERVRLDARGRERLGDYGGLTSTLGAR